MTPLDITILAAYFLGVVCLGSVFYRGQKSLADFFLAERNIPWWAAAFSGIATILRAISFLGAPGQAFKSDLRFLQYRLGTPIALLLIGWVMIPFFYRLRVFSIYEYLEQRFDLRTRLLGGVQFFILKTLYLAISIYAPALLFVQMSGLPLPDSRALSSCSVRSFSTCAAGISSSETYSGNGSRPAMCIATSLQKFLKSSVRATKSVWQLASRRTPILPPMWL